MKKNNKNKIIRRYGKPIDMRSLDRTPEWRLKIATEQKTVADKFSNSLIQVDLCPVCKSNQYQDFVDVYNYPYFECLDCGHIFCGFLPDAAKLIELYQSGENGEENIQNQVYLGDEIFKKRLEFIAKPSNVRLGTCM